MQASLSQISGDCKCGSGGALEDAAGAVYLFCIPESDYASGQVLMCFGGFAGICFRTTNDR